VLTGGGDDGVTGLTAIKAAGGLAIAQDPEGSQSPSMPWNAVCHDHLDLVLPLDGIALALTALSKGTALERSERAERLLSRGPRAADRSSRD
jgi:chemotaxis response regulator CheB